MRTEEDFISESAKKMKRHQPSNELWKKIETDLKEAEIHRGRVSHVKIIFKPFVGFFTGETITSKLAIASILVICMVSLSIFYLNPVGVKKETQADKIDQSIQNARMDYQRSISELESFVEKNKENIDARLYSTKKEKLSFINESINECERALSENELNIKVQQFLKQSLDQKLSTLKELVNSVKETKKHENS